MFWLVLLALMLVLSYLGLHYLSKRIAAFPWFQKNLTPKKGRWLSFLLLLLVLGGFAYSSNLWNAMVLFLHLVFFTLVFDGLALVFHKNRAKATLLAFLVTLFYLLYAFFSLHHVVRTHYELSTDKKLGKENFRIVGFSDSHMGTVFHAERLKDYVERMNDENPDVVVIVGDFIDDDTSREELEKSCKALSGLKATYGVYYVYGNHDRGYYRESRRGYGEKDLIANLEKNGVTILKDQGVALGEGVYLCGREDKSRGREPISVLMENISQENYVVILDHQPADYEAEAAAGCDLILSGHTHGGQLYPITKFSEWTGINDATYGEKKVGDTTFIVSSGIADWALQFKTGCISEYVVVDISSSR